VSRRQLQRAAHPDDAQLRDYYYYYYYKSKDFSDASQKVAGALYKVTPWCALWCA